MIRIRKKRLANLISLSLLTALLLSMMCNFNVSLADSKQGDFNVYAYANRYEDLQKVYKGNLEGYEQHYNQYGIKEGRNGKAYPGNDERNYKLTFNYVNTVYNGADYSAVFDSIYYLNKYADLKKAYGDDQQKAFNHFINYGMKEGRSGIAGFNVYAYANRYADLQKTYGANLPLYYKHYAIYGKKEGRNGAAFAGSDIRNSKITFTYVSRVSDGVDYSSEFDAVYYLNTYADIRKAYGNDQQKAFNHFINYGMKEGRRGNASFNVFTYANTYSDLLGAYGGDLQSYYKHYATYGKKEGRTATGNDTGFNGTNKIVAKNLGNGMYKISIINPYTVAGSVSEISFPTWSEEAGQDDIIWYKGVKGAGGVWTAIIDGNSHNSTGKYITHVYAKVNGKSIMLGSTSYTNNFTQGKHYGWYERNGKYYYYDRTTGVMQKGGTACNIKLNADGSAVVDNYAKEKILVMIKAREVVEQICNPSDSLAVKQEECYQYVAQFPYLLKDYPVGNCLNNYYCLDAHYANNILNAYGDQERQGAECVGEAAALAYLYAELNFGDVYLYTSNVHGWVYAGGRYWDPLFVESKGRQYYNASSYSASPTYTFKIN